jgi:hypothetical protein
MKQDVPVPLVVAAVVLVLGGIIFFAYRQSVPHAPPGARPAAQGIRESLTKELGHPIGLSGKERSERAGN